MWLRLSYIAVACAASIRVTYALPEYNELTRCTNSFDSWGIACKSLPTCENAPDVVLGQWYKASKIKARHTGLTTREAQGYHHWCQIGTRTYIGITFLSAVNPTNVISNMLDQAYQNIIQTIANNHDGIIGTQGFRWLGAQATTLVAQDANNHQLTWGVLGAALSAVKDFMNSNGEWGTVTFDIFDGDNQTGKGSIST